MDNMLKAEEDKIKIKETKTNIFVYICKKCNTVGYAGFGDCSKCGFKGKKLKYRLWECNYKMKVNKDKIEEEIRKYFKRLEEKGYISFNNPNESGDFIGNAFMMNEILDILERIK